MHDELEAVLRRYRPAGPPEALRDRVLATARSGRPTRWEWLPAVAAAAVAALLYTLAAGVRADVLTVGGPSGPSAHVLNGPREAILRELATTLGDGARARDEANWILMFDDEQMQDDREAVNDTTPEGARP